MAIRQYIGARYTIKIYENSLDPSSADWESGIAYEYLTLVIVNKDAYLSKKDVPSTIGSPASNPAYWVKVGDFNGQIANLQYQIDTINSVLTPLSDPFYVMVSTGDTTDRTSELTNALLNKKAVLFSEGDFYFNSTVSIPDGSTLIGCGMNTRLCLANDATGYIFNVGNDVIISNIKFDGGLSAAPTSIGNRGAISFNNKSLTFKLSNCEITGFAGCGVFVKDAGFGHLGSIECTNTYFRYNGAGIYFDHHGEYGLVTNCTFLDCYKGAVIGGGNNQFTNCGFNRCTYGADVDGSISTNNGHGILSSCTFNHNTNIGLNIKDLTYGMIVDGCVFALSTNADLYCTNSTGGVNITSCLFGSNAKIGANTNAKVFMSNCAFMNTPASIAIDSTSKIIGMANYKPDGTRIASLCKSVPFGNERLTKSYISNTSVDETSFNNIAFELIGGVIYAIFTINVTSAPSGFVTIGTLDIPAGYTIFDSWNVYSSTTGGIFLVGILHTGEIQIYTYNAGTGTIRATIPIPLIV